MRELKEIVADIDKLNGEIQVLRDKQRDLYIERNKRIQYDIEMKYQIKRGDLVELRTGKRFYYDCVKPYSDTLVWIYCRKSKKDGSPSRNSTSLMTESFKDCKVIGHAELP